MKHNSSLWQICKKCILDWTLKCCQLCTRKLVASCGMEEHVEINISFLFLCNKSKRWCISCHCHHYQPHLHDSPGSSLEYVRTEYFLGLRNQSSYTRVQKIQSPFPPEIFLLSQVKGTAKWSIQVQQNQHTGRKLLKYVRNMQHDQLL